MIKVNNRFCPLVNIPCLIPRLGRSCVLISQTLAVCGETLEQGCQTLAEEEKEDTGVIA